MVSMHHPDEVDEDDDDEFLSDDAEVGDSKDKTKQKGMRCLFIAGFCVTFPALISISISIRVVQISLRLNRTQQQDK